MVRKDIDTELNYQNTDKGMSAGDKRQETRADIYKWLGLTAALQIIEFLALQQVVDLQKLTDEGWGILIGMAMISVNQAVAGYVVFKDVANR